MLTIDIGNTRLKWALWDEDVISRAGGCEHLGEFDDTLFEDCLPSVESYTRVVVANVAGEVAAAALESWLRGLGSKELTVFETSRECCGVTNAYADPSMHGVDRWVALIAAHAMCETNACVIDIGTAVTVDLVNAEGLHEGGMIMPGLELMRASLNDKAADIRLDAPEAGAVSQQFAADTEAAIYAGTSKLLCSGLEGVCSQVSEYYGGDVTLFFTGGAADSLLPLLSVKDAVNDPQLVMKGLRLGAGD